MVILYNESSDWNDNLEKEVAKYGQADKGSDLCFAHLVKFDNQNGVNIARPNSLRDDYLLDLSKALFKALDENFPG